MPLVKSTKHKYCGLRVPVYYQTSARVSEGSIFKRQPTDRLEGYVEIIEVIAKYPDTVICKVEFLDTPVDVTAVRYIDPEDIAQALKDNK